MDNVGNSSEALRVVDPRAIGWWIESSDEELYGPVSRATLRRFLEEGYLSANTLVRHATLPESSPVVDQPGVMESLTIKPGAPAIGDRLADVWPRKTRERLALAEESIPCARHTRSAVGFCVRCHAPYCNRCRAKPHRLPFFFCRRCQSNNHNRRAVAIILDGMLLNYVPVLLTLPVAVVLGQGVSLFAQIGGTLLFIVRDALFRGAGPGKRVLGLRVVQIKDGATPLTYGQGVLRWLSIAIPFFNLVDMSVPYRDPLQRRYGDRWAKTRVVDTERALAKARSKVRRWLAKKGFMPAMEEPAKEIERFAQPA